MFRLHGVVLILIYIGLSSAATCNVLDYGAKSDNKTDIGPAILNAYKNCIQKSPGSTLLIPAGNFLLDSVVELGGSGYNVQLDGTITLAFNTKLGGYMIDWQHCSNIVLSGSGKINGQGNLWRPNGDLSKYPSRPRLVRFLNCNNCKISGIHLNNAPMFHLVVNGNNNEVHNVVVTADIIGETDAFDISGDNNYVHDVEVTNGDECVTVKTPTNGFRAENIICHYTAGCNMGSFGNAATNAAVSNVYYKNVTMYNSEAGAQIKTYPNNLGYVRNVTYENFKLVEVDYPMAINLFWCPHTKCPATTGTLTISDVTFRNFQGTENGNSRPEALVDCISGHRCTNINFENIQVTASNGAATHDAFTNACGTGRPTLPKC
jgi:rhamnogalacturonan hydrolase